MFEAMEEERILPENEEEEDSCNEYERAYRIEHDERDDDLQNICDNEYDDDFHSDSEVSADGDLGEVEATPHVTSFQTRPLENLPVTLKQGTTSNDFLLPILAASIRFDESYEQTLTHLRIIKSRLGNSTLPSTKKGLWTALERNDINITRYLYCHECRSPLGIGDNPTEQCPCKSCGPGQEKTNIRHFLKLNLTAQICQLLSIPTIAESLNYRFNRVKRRPDAVEDLYDGEESRRLSAPGGFLSHSYNYSLTFNTDGLKVTNSSGVSAWPLYVQINELPPHLRGKHMLLVGVFVDDKHPSMNVYMKPFIEEINKLHQTGVIWRPTAESPLVTSKFMVIIGTVDSPARALLTRTKQFNGLHGCLYCYAEGEQVNDKRIYPVRHCFGRLRTSKEFKRHAKKACETQQPYLGIKGIPSLVGLPGFDICKGMVVDAMHGMHLGAIRQHTKLLLTSCNAPFYIGSPNIKAEIDRRLLLVRFPKRRSRSTRSITTTSLWKASEWRNWVEVAPACLEGILHKKYANHIALSSQAMHYLDSDSVMAEELNLAERLLTEYVHKFEEYFGEENMSFNIHLMTHISNNVRDWGPTWATDVYKFESWNKTIAGKVTSPMHRAEQIANRFLMAKFIDLVIWDEDTSEETKSLVAQIRKIYRGHEGAIREEFTGLGKLLRRVPTDAEKEALLSRLGFAPEYMTCYQKAKICGNEYRSKNNKNTKFNNSTIYSDDYDFGDITNIVQIQRGENSLKGIFMNKFKVIRSAFSVDYIKQIAVTDAITFIEITQTIRPGVQVNMHNHYCYKLPNCWTID